jgi:hypothetical protein
VLKTIILFGILIGAVPAIAAAQSAANVRVGDRLRVSAADRPVVIGRVTAANAAAIELQQDGADAPVSMSRAGMRRIEISRGGVSKGQGAKRGAIWGAVIAGVAGAISLGLQHEQVGEDGSSVGKAAALGAFSGGLFGGLIGAGIGAARAGERWEPVWP